MAERVDPVSPLKLASLLLQYPRAELRAAAAAAAKLEIGPGAQRAVAPLRDFCRWYAGRPLAELERRYVDAFDFTKQCSLHLSYHVHGDRRQRGMAMLQLKEAYRAAGFEPPADELPDYLPLMLEFAAIAPGAAGRDLLEDNRVSIELVRAGLKREESPFAPLLEVVVGSLGKLNGRKLARIRKLAAEGPPAEEVGLEPFAPPEVMPTAGPEPARPLVGGRGETP
ncbi:MAG TPA: nitrate reductase molybdenum cofactor assembly chaperone [Solirubrobacterales bacterium]|nr:nitrate reductase molybdenum cofactor assembly chaperone [Solirubrobacterales bacterium]